jgi:hypothetical protein
MMEVMIRKSALMGSITMDIPNGASHPPTTVVRIPDFSTFKRMSVELASKNTVPEMASIPI